MTITNSEVVGEEKNLPACISSDGGGGEVLGDVGAAGDRKRGWLRWWVMKRTPLLVFWAMEGGKVVGDEKNPSARVSSDGGGGGWLRVVIVKGFETRTGYR